MACVSVDERWIVVLVSFLGCTIAGGISYSSSIFYVEWLTAFAGGYATTSAVASLNVGLFSLVGPLASILVNRIGYRWVIIISGVVSSSGMVAAATTESIYVLMVAFGIVTGIGFGLCFTPFAVVPAIYLPEHQTLVTGLALSGIGFGPFLVPMIMEYTIELYGWRGSMLILAGISLNLCVCGAFIRPLKSKPPPEKLHHKSLISFASLLSLDENVSRKDVFQLSIFKSVSYVMFLLHICFFTLGLSVQLVHMTALVKAQTGVSKFQSSVFLMAYGVSNFIGRIIHGFIGHIKQVHVYTQYLIGYAICATFVFLMTTTTSFHVMLAFACVVAFTNAPFGSLIPAILSENVGNDQLATAYGYMCLSCGIGLTLGAPIAGWLFRATNDYNFSLYFTGTVTVMSVIILIPFCWRSFKKHRKIRNREIEFRFDDVASSLLDLPTIYADASL